MWDPRHTAIQGIEAIRSVIERAVRDRSEGDRGDIPGWVMLTLMSALVVVALLAIFQDQVIAMVRDAFSQFR